MSKLKEFLEHLQINLIVFVENDFTPYSEYDGQKIFNQSIFLNSFDFPLLCEELRNQYNFLSEQLQKFRTQYLVENKQFILSGRPLIDPRKDAILSEEEKSIVQFIENKIKTNTDFKNVFFKYGIGNVSSLYFPIIDDLNRLNSPVSIRFYRNILPNEYDLFLDDIRCVLNLSQTKLFVSIFDILDVGSHGGDLLMKDISEEIKRKKENFEMISILYTSKKSDEFDSNNSREMLRKIIIRKNSDTNVIEKISKGFASIAYDIFFKSIIEIKTQSLSDIQKLAMETKSNINYLADMAHLEGVTALEFIEHWINLNHKNQTLKKLLDHSLPVNINYISGLTNLIKTDYFYDETNQINAEFRKTVQEMNEFEIFDYHVNQFHLPTASGDIYLIGNNYYILLGQDCDLMVREIDKKIKRTEKTAILLKSEFKRSALYNKTNATHNKVSFNYFRNEKNEIGSIDVLMQNNNILNATFELLDLCVFNQDGKSYMCLKESLPKGVSNLLPKYWCTYYSEIKNNIHKKFGILKKFNDCNLPIFYFEGPANLYDLIETNLMKTEIGFQIRRVARLKGEFKDFLYKKYLDYKSRVGYNTVNLTHEQSIPLKSLSYGFLDNQKKIDKPYNILIQYSGDRKRNEELMKSHFIIEKSKFIKELPPPYSELFNQLNEKITIETDSYFDEKSNIEIKKLASPDKKMCDGLVIVFPLQIEGTKKYIKKSQLYITEIIEDISDPKNVKCIYKDSKEDFFVKQEYNGLEKEFDVIKTLKRGLIFPDLKKSIKLDMNTGKIKIEEEKA